MNIDGSGPLGSVNAAVATFREIHKNTWLKRLSTEGRKKSERSWVVFCVHDDSEALLEGYAEPRQGASHIPEWIVSLQKVQHISHALIPNSHEFEFVITLSDEVIRFHAMSWEIMQEWVETLRAKLREMKILSPRENLYTKLPEVRQPLLPTRDPTSPLPATPPVPAAIVPGIERVVTNSANIVERLSNESRFAATSNNATFFSSSPPSISNSSSQSMSNTLTQNLLNMLSDPISNYSEQINEAENDRNDSISEIDRAIESDVDDDDDDDDDVSASLLRVDIKPSEGAVAKNTKITAPASENSVRVDIASVEEKDSTSAILEPHKVFKTRFQATRSCNEQSSNDSSEQSIPTTSSNNNVTELEIKDNQCQNISSSPSIVDNLLDSTTNITIIQVSNMSAVESFLSDSGTPTKMSNNFIISPTLNAVDNSITPNSSNSMEPDFFKFPEINEHKSNVQIIPSNSSTIPVGGLVNVHSVMGSSVANQYSSPKKNISAVPSICLQKKGGSHLENHQITMVRVGTNYISDSADDVSVPIFEAATKEYVNGNLSETAVKTSTLPKKMILSANSSGVTSISINDANSSSFQNVDKNCCSDPGSSQGIVHYEKVFLTSSIPIASDSFCLLPKSSSSSISTQNALKSPKPRFQTSRQCSQEVENSIQNFSPQAASKREGTNESKILDEPSTSAFCNNSMILINQGRNRKTSPAQKKIVSAEPTFSRSSNPPNLPARPPFLIRGLTEAVISGRPSRKDQMRTTVSANANTSNHQNISSTNNTNNNGEVSTVAGHINTRSESFEQRPRSSSTSDVQNERRSFGNNNEILTSAKIVMQEPPQPFKNGKDGALQQSASKRMTLREQQVLRLRREIMHPGGVRLQLRRKDCIGSIAWVDAFGAVWIAGWKQKEHPVLYNALHIGDQLISIGGIIINSAAETNKIIRNANTLFVEVVVRRIPFGRVYAIRREREGQCLGLIRDGNTSTIVDVIPKSLAARHGLPPKAQSCDGTALTFWVLTEINGRPLNLFFKENEIRDRLNSVGRDISILVQPSDLITKLKKQLKSLRGHKDYLVQ